MFSIYIKHILLRFIEYIMGEDIMLVLIHYDSEFAILYASSYIMLYYIS